MPDQSIAETEQRFQSLKEVTIQDLKPEYIQQILEGWEVDMQSHDVWNFSSQTEDGKTKRLSIDKVGKSVKYFPDFARENVTPAIRLRHVERVSLGPEPSWEIHFFGQDGDLYKIENKGKNHKAQSGKGLEIII